MNNKSTPTLAPQSRQRGMKQTIRAALSLFDLAPIRSPPFLRRLNRFRRASRTDKFIAPSLLASERWEALPGNPSGPLYEGWASTKGSHKWRHYFEIYERVFSRFRDSPISILEIGVHRGGSLRTWHSYFNRAKAIVGIDIDPACMASDKLQSNIHVRTGSQADVAFLDEVVHEFGPFDIIIDDGSHVSSDIIASFNFLFVHGLSGEGIYLVEDLHSNYWPWGRDLEVSFMDIAKRMIDLMHSHFWDHRSERQFRIGSDRRVGEVVVPKLAKILDRIEICDSVCVLYKRKKILPAGMVS